MIIVSFLKDWTSPPDDRGDTMVFRAGWTGEVTEDWAGYCIARDYARNVETLPESLAIGIATLRQIIAAYQERRTDPTYSDVYDAVARLAAAASEGVAG